MSKAVIGKFLQKDVRRKRKEHFPRLGFDIEFEGLLNSEYQNLTKEHTVILKDGTAKFQDDDFTYSLIARMLKRADGEELDLTKRETLEEFGVKTIKEALDLMFNVAELKKVVDIVNSLVNEDKEQEVKEIEELKN